jgi:hypothetical protein
MTAIAAPDRRPPAGRRARTSARPAALGVAALASVGAGAIHAAAAGSHSAHLQAAFGFVAMAALQVGWGALTRVRAGRLTCLLGAAVNAAAIAGWVLAKTTGIDLVDGLEAAEPPDYADTLAAGLATVAVVGALLCAAGRSPAVRHRTAVVGVAAVATVALAVPGVASVGGHQHAGGHDHADGRDHGTAGQPTEPYDATLPVDLGGVPGVSADEQAEAEDVVTITLEKLPQFADTATAEAMGYRSIGDADSGYEHYVNWSLLDDGRFLDPDYPESLVYEVDSGKKTLVAAMYMMDWGDTLDAVPDLGGDLVQWHVHDDLCFVGQEGAWRVGGVTPPTEDCPAGTSRLGGLPPMVHVWIAPHECGPFAALEGIGAGQIADGETRLCDHAHGS